MQYSEANQRWLEDASIRLLCVFALDRFADFVSDQVLTCVLTHASRVKHFSQHNSSSLFALVLCTVIPTSV